MGQADPILTKLGAGPAVKKLVETAIILNNSQDPQQRNHAYSFMESAIKELDGTVGSAPNEMGQFGNEDGLSNNQISEQNDDNNDDIEHKLVHEQKDDDDDKENNLKEEVLDNHNNGPREDGSEQSTENEEPYPGTALDSTNGEKPMQDMDGSINQWNETGGMPPGAGMGQPPMGQPPMGNMPGLAPDVAQEMGMIMPEIPPFNTNQMMRQMQYTVDNVVKNLYRKQIAPLQRILKHQKEIQKQQKDAITSLSQELRETKAASGTMKLDLDSMRRNAGAKFRETTTTPELQNFATFDKDGLPGVQPIRREQIKLESARSEIEQMDKMLNSKNNPMYN
jgi:hypothetical protein